MLSRGIGCNDETYEGGRVDCGELSWELALSSDSSSAPPRGDVFVNQSTWYGGADMGLVMRSSVKRESCVGSAMDCRRGRGENVVLEFMVLRRPMLQDVSVVERHP